MPEALFVLPGISKLAALKTAENLAQQNFKCNSHQWVRTGDRSFIYNGVELTGCRIL